MRSSPTDRKLEEQHVMYEGNMIGLARPIRSTNSGDERLLAELDDLSLYKLVRRARQKGITISRPPEEDAVKAPPSPELRSGR